MTRTPRWFQTGILVVGIGLTILVVSRAEQIAFDDQVRSEQHLVDTALAGQERSAAVGHATFMSPHAAPIAVSRGHVFVVNTPGDTVDVIDVSSRAIVTRVNVGIDPVGIAVRPDGNEVEGYWCLHGPDKVGGEDKATFHCNDDVQGFVKPVIRVNITREFANALVNLVCGKQGFVGEWQAHSISQRG